MIEKIKNIKIKKNTLIVLTAGVVVFTIILLIVFFISRNNQPRNAEEKFDNSAFMTTYIYSGAPRIQKNELTSKTFNFSERVTDNSKILTDSISRGVVTFKNNSLILIDKDSEVDITRQGNDIKVSVIKGSAYLRVEQNLNFTGNYGSINTDHEDGRVVISYEDKVIFNQIRGKTIIDMDGDEGEVADAQTLELNIIDLTSLEIESLPSKIKSSTEDETEWGKTYKCIDNKITDLLIGGNATKEWYLNSEIDGLLDCKTKLDQASLDKLNDENLQKAQQQTNTEQTNQTKKPPVMKVVNDQGSFTTEDKLVCTFSAEGEKIQNYEYSIGTAPGGTDIKTWTKSDSTSITASSLGMQYAKTYYCNARAINEYGKSDIKSTDGIIFDNSQATLTINAFNMPGKITGSVTYSGVTSDTDLVVKVYLKDGTTSKYSNGAEWVTNQILHDTNKTSGSSSFTWSSITTFNNADFTSGTVYAEVKNIKTGRILDQTINNVQ